jgi:hypothetical protein
MRVVGDIMILELRKLTFIIFLTVLLSIQIVSSLGLTRPTSGINLLRGDSTQFSFQIQAVTSTEDQSCTYSMSGLDPLIITFDENQVIVKAGEIKNVYGTVSIPDDAEIKKYTGEITVKCKPQVEGVSGSLIQRTMISDFSVSVVGTEEERETRSVPKEKVTAPLYNFPMILLIIVVMILVVGVYLWTEKKKK